MFKNYLTVAIRNLARHKVYSFINIAGLAVGIACCVLIGLYIHSEWMVNRYHIKADRIYRLLRESNANKENIQNTSTSGAFHRVLKHDFPEVETAIRFNWEAYSEVRYGNKESFNKSYVFADADFFDVFDVPLIKGNMEDITQQPNTMVLSETFAKQLFGAEDPMGKVVYLGRDVQFQGDLVVRGVMEDPSHWSSLKYDILLIGCSGQGIQKRTAWDGWEPEGFGYPRVRNYVVLKPGVDAKAVQKKLNAALPQYIGAELAKKYTYHLQPLTRIYLYSGVDFAMGNLLLRSNGGDGDIRSLYLLSATAFLILLIACINFTNLTTARSARRAQEVGLRKVVGALRVQIMKQFLGEAMLLVCVTTVIALGLIELSLPHFSAFMEKPALSLHAPGLMQVMIAIISLIFVVGFLAGAYPALFLSAFQPVETLKGVSKTGRSGVWLRKGLVIVQFGLSILLIVSTAIVYQQMDFLRNQSVKGKETILWTEVLFSERRGNLNRETWLRERYPTVKNAILQNPYVLGITTTTLQPMDRWNGFEILETDEHRSPLQVQGLTIDEDTIPFLNLEIVAGRNFSSQISADATQAFIVNESAARLLGWDDPIDKTITFQKQKGQIVGVVKDFLYMSLHNKVHPLVLRHYGGTASFLLLRLHTENLNETIASVKSTIYKLAGRPVPARWAFMDEQFEVAYRREIRTGTITTLSSILAIFLACLGLFGLSAYAAETRTKEIGVRKVLGASVTGIMALLSKDFIKLVLIANLIAWPVAYYAANRWLQEFAYRIDISLWPFALGTLLALAIALGTVSYQAFKAARSNPIEALRYE